MRRGKRQPVFLLDVAAADAARAAPIQRNLARERKAREAYQLQILDEQTLDARLERLRHPHRRLQRDRVRMARTELDNHTPASFVGFGDMRDHDVSFPLSASPF